MSLEVYINNELIDLKDVNNIGLTFQIGSILNINSKAGNLSNSFTVPKTLNNTRILGHLSSLNSGSNIPYSRNTGDIVQNGLSLFNEGLAIIESAGKDYSLTIYSGNVSFFDLIKDKNVSDLDLSLLTHRYRVSVVVDSFTDNVDYIYPIIDWGVTPFLDNTTTVNTDSLIPCLKMKPLLVRIADEQGYELTGSFVNSDELDKMVLTPNSFKFTDEQLAFNGGIVSTPTVINQDVNGSLSPGTSTSFPISFNAFFWDAYNVGGQEFIPDNNFRGNIGLVLSGTVENISATSNMNIRVFAEIFENGILYLSETSVLILPNAGQTLEWSASLSFSNVLAVQGVSYTAKVRINVTTDAAIQPCTTLILDEGFFNFTPIADIQYDSNINMDDLYDWKQQDVFKDVMKQYSLTVQTNNITKQVFISRLDELINNLDVSKDWSDKIDLTSTPNTKYILSGYAQTNKFNYSNDGDNGPITLADEKEVSEGSFNILDETMTNEKDLIKLICVPARSGVRVGGELISVIPFMDTLTSPIKGKKSRHLLIDQISKSVDFENTITVESETTATDIPFAYFKKTNKTDSLDFDSLITENYETIQSMTNKTKFVTANFNLKEIDVYNLDFTIPIKLDVHRDGFQANGFFYINKISNFKNNKPTKVDLIRL